MSAADAPSTPRHLHCSLTACWADSRTHCTLGGRGHGDGSQGRSSATCASRSSAVMGLACMNGAEGGSARRQKRRKNRIDKRSVPPWPGRLGLELGSGARSALCISVHALMAQVFCQAPAALRTVLASWVHVFRTKSASGEAVSRRLLSETTRLHPASNACGN